MSDHVAGDTLLDASVRSSEKEASVRVACIQMDSKEGDGEKVLGGKSRRNEGRGES